MHEDLKRFPHIKKWIHSNQGHKIGLLIAVKDGNHIGIGWSKCCKRDKFDKHLAEQIAYGRAMIYNIDHSLEIDFAVHNTLPFAIEKEFGKFVQRAKKYFKIPFTITVHTASLDQAIQRGLLPTRPLADIERDS